MRIHCLGGGLVGSFVTKRLVDAGLEVHLYDVMERQTNAIFDLLVKECSDQDISFDKLLAKMALKYYFTVGENYNRANGDMFNKVTLIEFLSAFFKCNFLFHPKFQKMP